jgi:hypothetical protein
MQNTLLHYLKSKQVWEYRQSTNILGLFIDGPLRKHIALVHNCTKCVNFLTFMGLEKPMYQLLMDKQAENSCLPGLQTSLI